MAENVNERVEPSAAAEEIYVELDDLDSGSLHIRGWARTAMPSAQRCGCRRATLFSDAAQGYQRKLAVDGGVLTTIPTPGHSRSANAAGAISDLNHSRGLAFQIAKISGEP